MIDDILKYFVPPILTGLSLGSVFVFWLKKKITISIENKVGIVQKDREVYSRLLELHSELVGRDLQTDWYKRYFPTLKDTLLWCSDDVVREYTRYAKGLLGEKKIEGHHLHFAKAILAFRNGLGHKNWFGRIKPEDIAITFFFGQDQE
jgi:hypothetical protein